MRSGDSKSATEPRFRAARLTPARARQPPMYGAISRAQGPNVEQKTHQLVGSVRSSRRSCEDPAQRQASESKGAERASTRDARRGTRRDFARGPARRRPRRRVGKFRAGLPSVKKRRGIVSQRREPIGRRPRRTGAHRQVAVGQTILASCAATVSRQEDRAVEFAIRAAARPLRNARTPQSVFR
jgi:hypothetical protein